MGVIKEIICNKKRLKVAVNSDADESVFGEVFVDREYRILDQILGKAVDPILDIGAHVGMFSIYARCFNSNAQIFAFEPEEKNFAAMKENLRVNGIGDVFAKNVAVTGEIGMRELNISQDSHNHSFLKVENEDGEAVDGLAVRKVNTTTLQQIFMKNNLARVSLAKIDCEGAEFEIFVKTPVEILQKVGAFYIEYHKYENNNPQILRAILEKAGFKVEMKESFYDKRFGFILGHK